MHSTRILNIFFVMIIFSNEKSTAQVQQTLNAKSNLHSNMRFRRLTVPLNGWHQYQQQQQQQQAGASSFYGLPYVRSPWDYIINRRNYLLTVAWSPHLNEYTGYPSRIQPIWQASSKLIGGEGIDGIMTFQQIPYSNQIRVTLNATGLPPGKHALHIHTYGDVNDDCQSTGGQFANTFLGNVEAKEDGSISVIFINMFLNLFGFNGIIGRSIVIHENPIDLNTALNADIYSVPAAFETEEKSLGKSLACGIISITNAQKQQNDQPEVEIAEEQTDPANEK